MTQPTIWILGNQLLKAHPALVDRPASEVRVLLIESHAKTHQLPYQRKKLVLLFSAMRHYAARLRRAGYQVDYRQAASFTEGLKAHVAEFAPRELVMMASTDYHGRVYQQTRLADIVGCPVTVLPNTQFLIAQHNPIPQPEPDKRYVLEHFYRDMRRHFGVLMDGDEPVGGAWNYDHENRRPLPKKETPPPDNIFPPNELTQAVMQEVEEAGHGVGTAVGFAYAVTHEQAEQAADQFFAQRFAKFGPYEDALTQRSHSLYHSMLSPYLNLGLLEPLPLIRRAEQAYVAGEAPLNSVEGFIRQLLGWREFIYWQYWRQMPGMKQKNGWQATRPLPDFFWTGETEMACLRHALQRAIATGYNHHIERLMLLSNFCLLAGINPAVVNDWFTALYIDAYEWVMPPNVIGMALNADGGLTATKPYIASANYINKMGDFCQGCAFDHKQRVGERACPFNFLYWHFILEHEQTLRANPRLGKNVLGLRYLDEAERTAVRAQAAAFLAELT